MNSGPTAWADTNGWKLVLETTIQPPAGSPGELDTPMQALLTPGGDVVVGDWRTPSVTRYDAHGRFVRNIGRLGEGPGEYRLPELAVDHDTLIIDDPRLNRVMLMTPDGRMLRQFPGPAGGSGINVPPMVDGTGRIAVGAYRGYVQWALVDHTGRQLDSLRPPSGPPNTEWTFKTNGGVASYRIPFSGLAAMTLLRNGSVAWGSGDSYSLCIGRDPADTTLIFGRRDVSPLPIPDRLRDSMFHLMVDHFSELRGTASESDVPKAYPLWSAIQQDGNGNIWVARDGPPTGPARFDVFSEQGVLLGSVVAPFVHTGRIRVEGSHVVVIDTGANDLPRIRVYRIDKRGFH